MAAKTLTEAQDTLRHYLICIDIVPDTESARWAAWSGSCRAQGDSIEAALIALAAVLRAERANVAQLQRDITRLQELNEWLARQVTR